MFEYVCVRNVFLASARKVYLQTPLDFSPPSPEGPIPQSGNHYCKLIVSYGRYSESIRRKEMVGRW